MALVSNGIKARLVCLINKLVLIARLNPISLNVATPPRYTDVIWNLQWPKKNSTLFINVQLTAKAAQRARKNCSCASFTSRVITNHRRSLAGLYWKSIPVWYFMECSEEEMAAIWRSVLWIQYRKMLMLPNEMWERKRKTRIIRHLAKVMTIPANATAIHNAKRQTDSFSQMVCRGIGHQGQSPSCGITWRKNTRQAIEVVILVPTLCAKWVKIPSSCHQMLKHTYTAQMWLIAVCVTPSEHNWQRSKSLQRMAATVRA